MPMADPTPLGTATASRKRAENLVYSMSATDPTAL
jgi:hypothetical protein